MSRAPRLSSTPCSSSGTDGEAISASSAEDCAGPTATDPPQTTQYTIILLSKRDFVFTDQEIVFYETQLK